MKKLTIILFTISILTNYCFGQTLVSDRESIEKAKIDLQNEMSNFSSCIVKQDLNICIENLIKSADNEYKKYVIGGTLYEIDPKQALILHKQAYLKNQLDKNFTLEYAIELHRSGKYLEASKLYETYSLSEPNDIRIFVWLSDCYLNLNQTDLSIKNWQKANHPQNHTAIDKAIYIIYGKTDQVKTRNDLKVEIEKGNFSNFYPLLFLDKNWEYDWWNKGSQDYFIEEDLALAQNKLGKTNNDYKVIEAYLKIKNLEEKGEIEDTKKLLLDNNLILNNKPIPKFGEFASDLLRICFVNGLLSETEFYSKRGNELLNLAKKTKDKGILNIYAYLQANIDGQVKPEIDKLGWTEFNDERFAVSYFSIRTNKIKSDDAELNEALKKYPDSPYLWWIKAKCTKVEGKTVKELLIELIKREFKTLGTDPNKYSYRLKSYMNTLAEEK